MNDRASPVRPSLDAAADSVPERVARLRRELHEAGSMLADGRRALADGRVPDLAPLVPRIEGMTGAIAALPVGEGRPLRPALMALLDEMTQLGRRLVEERDRLGLRLRDQPAHHRASVAYRDRGRS